MKRKIELRPFCEMIKYGHRGPNLAVFFLRQGILQMRMSEAEMGLILAVDRDGKNAKHTKN